MIIKVIIKSNQYNKFNNTNNNSLNQKLICQTSKFSIYTLSPSSKYTCDSNEST